ncbi:MAG TPA: hypothetical protein DHU55_05695 [Blastocatellia bacterium]|jgi:predicted metalloprotease with PDZ domain|nr:hypothetical protein [Blastocatellia bacterium]HAF22959.1 hypothetical protein [Blastocatellia bacterium]HCX29252.1 hypothetical protein [Blastocatellia bacterium]
MVVGAAAVNAQTLRARIAITSVAPARIRITGGVPSAATSLSFRNNYGGVLGLGERIEKLEVSNQSGESLPVQKLAPGEYQAAQKFTRFSYDVDVGVPSRPSQMSHVSSLSPEHGLLMLADLLPLATKDAGNFSKVAIQLDVPPGWTIRSNARSDGSGYSSDEPEKTVFMVGPSLREASRRIGLTKLSVITSGEWPFSGDDATKTGAEIIEEYLKVTGFMLKRDALVMLLPYPGESSPEKWSAETRGNVVVLLLGRRASRKTVLAMLEIILTHELFHLWVPNSLKLAGDYDWFFEGFTLYQALRTDVRLSAISFDDYLATLARVYDSYLASADSDTLSLLEASERRWTTSSSLVYDKGMLVAFIYDLMLSNRTDCAASFDDLYKELFRLVPTGQESANETIIKVLSEREGMESFVKVYVQSPDRVSLEPLLVPYGLQIQKTGLGTKLTVGPSLSKPQRKLLGCLGYRK